MARDETFGPVAPIMTFKDIDECLRIANETPYGLQGAAFTSSLRTAFLLGEGIECGTVLINETNNCWDQLSPFGGVKKSGLGRELQRLVLRRADRGQAAQHRHQQGEVRRIALRARAGRSGRARPEPLHVRPSLPSLLTRVT